MTNNATSHEYFQLWSFYKEVKIGLVKKRLKVNALTAQSQRRAQPRMAANGIVEMNGSLCQSNDQRNRNVN